MRPAVAARTTAEATPEEALVDFERGFSVEEWDGSESFRWMEADGRLAFAPADEQRFLELLVFSPFFDLSQELTVSAGNVAVTVRLVEHWGRWSFCLPPAADHVVLAVNKLLPAAMHPGDQRRLAIRVRAPVLHRDAQRHVGVERQSRNAVRNLAEMLAGRTLLESTPPGLGIDLHGVCNVRPPCVYCDWDHNKALEGPHATAPFTTETLRAMGPFFDNATELVNCSIGEPFMMKNLDELLDAFARGAKTLELATNGQILTERNISRLIGRPIEIFISLDAATAETYAKLRNDKFERIIANLRRLIVAKGGRGRLPIVHLVFMPMQVNVHELEAFVKLCAELEVDWMALRPLNYTDNEWPEQERAGHVFRYREQLLPWTELVRISGLAAGLCRRHGVALWDQMDFGGRVAAAFPDQFAHGRDQGAATEATAAAAAGAPSPQHAEAVPEESATLGEECRPRCAEPWRRLYILRRGIFPCCYGADPLAPMDEFGRAWNAPQLQQIRAALAAGRFHDYCLSASSCPVVRKWRATQAPAVVSTIPWWFPAARNGKRALGRLLAKLPGRWARPLRDAAARLSARVTQRHRPHA